MLIHEDGYDQILATPSTNQGPTNESSKTMYWEQ